MRLLWRIEHLCPPARDASNDGKHEVNKAVFFFFKAELERLNGDGGRWTDVGSLARCGLSGRFNPVQRFIPANRLVVPAVSEPEADWSVTCIQWFQTKLRADQ